MRKIVYIYILFFIIAVVADIRLIWMTRVMKEMITKT